MPQIEAELSITVLSGNIRYITSAGADQIIFEKINLSDADSATLAWLINKPPETSLAFELRVL